MRRVAKIPAPGNQVKGRWRRELPTAFHQRPRNRCRELERRRPSELAPSDPHGDIRVDRAEHVIGKDEAQVLYRMLERGVASLDRSLEEVALELCVAPRPAVLRG